MDKKFQPCRVCFARLFYGKNAKNKNNFAFEKVIDKFDGFCYNNFRSLKRNCLKQKRRFFS